VDLGLLGLLHLVQQLLQQGYHPCVYTEWHVILTSLAGTAYLVALAMSSPTKEFNTSLLLIKLGICSCGHTLSKPC
jgi:hypothetical protein